MARRFKVHGGRVHRSQIKKRAAFLAAWFSLVLGLLAARLYYIQITIGADQIESIVSPVEAIQRVLTQLP